MVSLPHGKRFAFSVLDDTDNANVANVGPIYALFRELGMRTTKTVWPLDCDPQERGIFEGSQTLQDPEYADFVRELVANGFEIASHNATMVSSERSRTVEGLEVLRSTFGSVPKIHCNHSQNRENLYWGANRYTNRTIRMLARGFGAVSGRSTFEGDDPASPYYWADLCERNFRFVRNFTFSRLDTSRLPPGGPYRRQDMPGIGYWFTTSDASDAVAFKRLFTRPRIDRLVRDGGVCILSTHLAAEYVVDGKVDSEIEATLRYLASFDGWFAPVSEILEHMLSARGEDGITPMQLFRLESAHVLDRLKGLVSG